jgi:tetratricopeptide (TPR) repeat protein
MKLLLVFVMMLTRQLLLSQASVVDFATTPPDLDTILPKIVAEKNDSIRYYDVLRCLSISETNPVLDMANSEKILSIGKRFNDAVCQVPALSCLAYDYRELGNYIKSLEYSVQSHRIAVESGDYRLISFAKGILALNYLDLGDNEKAIVYNKAAIEAAAKSETNIMTVFYILNMGTIYFLTNKIDSALIYTQQAYETSVATGINYWLGLTYMQLGTIHAKMKNHSLAMSYWQQALTEATRVRSPKFISIIYNEMAKYYFEMNLNDSALTYAKKAIATVDHTAFFPLSVAPAKLISDAYMDVNHDSAVKYLKLYSRAKDSLFSIKTIQQAQLMAFEEDARQQDVATQREKEKHERYLTIQNILVALGIVAFITLYLLLSRRIITNPRIIQGLGILALLIVFEFTYMLLHPLLEKITDHSPMLMLLSMVCIAAVLVPAHHRLQRWLTAKMVEKNKKIRLAAAKRTIAQLEK